MNIGIYANLSKTNARRTLAEIAATAKELGWALHTCDKATAARLPRAKNHSVTQFGKKIDVLLSLGGDGTVLHAVGLLKGTDVPVLGINLGNLGFLTGTPDADVRQAMLDLAARQYTVAQYPLLAATLQPGRKNAKAVTFSAVNDVVVGWGNSPRVTMIDVEIGQEHISSFVCDGIIVATPVGSTGHALSAGGPILHRDSASIVLTPICPHSLSNRPLVLPDSTPITLKVANDKKLLLSVDGQIGGYLQKGDCLHIQKDARQTANFILLKHYSWYSLLAQKLHWRGSSSDPK